MEKQTEQLGVVLLLDNLTKDTAAKLSKDLKGQNLIDLSKQHTSHVTLYHSKFNNVSEIVIDQLLSDISTLLPLKIDFNEISVFGDKFVFWNVEKTDILMDMHQACLSVLGDFFVSDGEQQSDKEKISLSPEEKYNVQQFGHPLVKELWQPHITLGYYPNGIEITKTNGVFTGSVVGVAFVRVGEMGTIKEIIQSK